MLICWIPLIAHINMVKGTPDFSRLEEKLEVVRETYNVPTVHAAITCNEDLLWAKGLGNQTALDTVFLIASLSKIFVGTSILQLYERGLVSLDTDISEYLPFDVINPDYPNKAITVRMLLKHTSGLRGESRYEFFWDTEGKYPDYPSWEKPGTLEGEKLLEMSLGEYLNESFTPEGSNYDPMIWQFRPNLRYSYSNVGFKLLQYLVEYTSGRSFEEYLKENIFNPLNMTNSGLNYSDFIAKHAIPYSRISGTNHEIEQYSTWMVRSSATDMANFMIAHLNSGKFGEKRILKPSTVAMMHSKLVQYSFYQNKILQDVNNYKFYQHSYGLGWSHFKDGFGGHGGSTPGFLAVTAGRKNPDGSSTGIVLFMNVNSLVINPSLDDFNEVQACYSDLINTILFELNLIPTINQESVDLIIFLSTFWLVSILVIHFGVRIINKEKLTNLFIKDISYTLLFLIFWLLALVIGLNYFYLNDWSRLLLFLPIVSYLGFIFFSKIRNKEEIILHFKKTRDCYFFQGWLVISLICLALYNSTFWTLKIPSLVSAILCIISISIVFIYDIAELLRGISLVEQEI